MGFNDSLIDVAQNLIHASQDEAGNPLCFFHRFKGDDVVRSFVVPVGGIACIPDKR
jgi:hypothetical protein